MERQPTKMAIYELTYSTKAASKEELSFSDVVLVEVETREELFAKVVDTLLRTLGHSGNYYVDSIGGDPYGPDSKKRIAKKIASSAKINHFRQRHRLRPAWAAQDH